MQPTYLPWSGYFALVESAEIFVFLDDVQFHHRSWQHRNRILTPHGVKWLTVPVSVKGRRLQALNEVEMLLGHDFPRSHSETLRHSYGKAPYWSLWGEEIKSLIDRTPESLLLADHTIDIVKGLSSLMGISTTWLRSSEIDVAGLRGEYLAAICQEVGATRYLSARGSSEYLREDGIFFDRIGVPIDVMDYVPPDSHETVVQQSAGGLSVVHHMLLRGPEARVDIGRGLAGWVPVDPASRL